METINERRLKKLLALAESKGGLSRVAEKAGLNPATLQQIAKGTLLPAKSDGTRSKRSLGDAAVAKLEDAWELGRGWFDDAHFYVQGSFATKTTVAPQQTDLDVALSTIREALAATDKTTRLALEPLFSALARDPETSVNSSQLIVKLLSGGQGSANIHSTVGADIKDVVLPTGGFESDGADNSIQKKRGIP